LEVPPDFKRENPICSAFSHAMTHLPLPVLISSLSLLLASLCIADTTTDLRKVFISMPPPQYPSDAWVRRSNGVQRLEGRTLVRVSVDASGAVIGVQIIKSSGSQILDNASVTALRRWRAKPGQAGRFYNIPVTFRENSHPPQAPVPNDGLGLSRGH
jgi:TonB family protein